MTLADMAPCKGGEWVCPRVSRPCSQRRSSSPGEPAWEHVDRPLTITALLRAQSAQADQERALQHHQHNACAPSQHASDSEACPPRCSAHTCARQDTTHVSRGKKRRRAGARSPSRCDARRCAAAHRRGGPKRRTAEARGRGARLPPLYLPPADVAAQSPPLVPRPCCRLLPPARRAPAARPRPP